MCLSHDGPAPLLAELVATLDALPGDVAAALHLARAWGTRFPLPAAGRTVLRWELLATLGAHDLQLARVVEPHVDALAILAEAGTCAGSATSSETVYGVFAAEAPGRRLTATEVDGRVVLSGEKPWCSLGTRLSGALVTAWVDERQRGLFEVALDDPGVTGSDEPWVSRGLPDVRSTGLHLDQVPGRPVGPGGPGWYLTRDGFAHGGLGVAAVWYGAAVALWRRLARPGGREPDQVALMHVGAAFATLESARALLVLAATELDAGRAGGTAGAVLAATVRTVVANAVEDVLRRCEHGLGPAPLVAEEDHAARVADLQVYVRQHHAERDEAGLGRLVLQARAPHGSAS